MVGRLVPGGPVDDRRQQSDNPLVALPLKEIDLNTLVTADDIGENMKWPPERCMARQSRFELQHQVARGDLSLLLSARDRSRVNVVANRLGTYMDQVSAIMLMNAPDLADRDLLLQVINAIENLVHNCMKHGRGVAVIFEEELEVYDMRYMWPFDSENDSTWALVEPYMSDATLTNQADLVRILIFEEDMVTGQIYEWDAGRIKKHVEDLDILPADLVVVDRPPVVSGWGQPALDDVLSIALEWAKRDSGISRVNRRNEYSPIALKADKSDILDVLRQMNSERPNIPIADMTTEERRKEAEELLDNEVIWLPKLIESIEYVLNTVSMENSFNFLDRLSGYWSMITGFHSPEQSNVGAESGVALALMNWLGAARTERLKNSIHVGLEQLIGPFDWPWFEDDGGSAATGEPDAPDAPAPVDDAMSEMTNA